MRDIGSTPREECENEFVDETGANAVTIGMKVSVHTSMIVLAQASLRMIRQTRTLSQPQNAETSADTSSSAEKHGMVEIYLVSGQELDDYGWTSC